MSASSHGWSDLSAVARIAKAEAEPVGDIARHDSPTIPVPDEDEQSVKIAKADKPTAQSAKSEAFYAIKAHGNAIELQVGPHNYRAIELRW